MEVTVENTVQKEHKGGKLDDVYKVTYYVVESLGKGLYKLKKSTRDSFFGRNSISVG